MVPWNWIVAVQLGTREVFGLMKMFKSWIVVMVAQLYKFIKKSIIVVIMGKFYDM